MQKPKIRKKKALSKKSAENWNWNEPSNEEFEKRRKKETFYKIYFLSDLPTSGKEEIVVYKFWAKSDKDAYKTLKKFEKSKFADPDIQYYYSTSGYYVGQDGKRYDGPESLHKDYLSGISPFKRMWMEISIFFTRFSDLWFEIKDLFRRAFKRHSIKESWDIYSHLLDDLEYNLPIMIKNLHGYPSSEGMTEKKWSDMLYDFLTHVRLYRFYSDFGTIDENDKEEVVFREEWGHTIPYVRGTNKELDYRRLAFLQKLEWNSIMNFLKRWGEALWD